MCFMHMCACLEYSEKNVLSDNSITDIYIFDELLKFESLS